MAGLWLDLNEVNQVSDFFSNHFLCHFNELQLLVEELSKESGGREKVEGGREGEVLINKFFKATFNLYSK